MRVDPGFCKMGVLLVVSFSNIDMDIRMDIGIDGIDMDIDSDMSVSANWGVLLVVSLE